MRILKVTQSYYPFLEKGSPAVKVRAIARALRRRGHRVTVLTVCWPDALKSPACSDGKSRSQ